MFELLSKWCDAWTHFVRSRCQFGVVPESLNPGQAQKRQDDLHQQVEQFANAMPEIVWTARPDGYLDYYNDRWYEYTGRPREVGGDESWKSVLHPDDVQKCLQTWYAAVESGNGYEIEYRFKCQKTGLYRWHLGRALPVKVGAGTIVRWIGTCTDIDDQKRVEEQLQQAREDLEARVDRRTVELRQATENLRRSEQRYRLLVEATTAVTWVTTATGEVDTDLIGWAEMTGQTLDQIKGRGWLDAIHPDDQAQTLRIWSTAIANKSLYQCEHRVRRQNGEYRLMLANAVPILNHDGTILEWMGVHTDITDRRRAEEALAESERFSRSTLDALSAHICIIDQRGLILATNLAWRSFSCQNAAKSEVGVGG